MDFIKRVESFLSLAKRLKELDQIDKEELFEKARIHNPWFTLPNIHLAFDGLLRLLDETKMKEWIDDYSELPTYNRVHTVGVVMAGNIPMVGIHDFICVLLSGHRLQAKLSSNDQILIPFIAQQLIDIEPGFGDRIQFVERLKSYDAIIATGSDNSARYFEYYFSKVPHIIRKNRTSVAVLNGEESDDQLKALSDDVFQYFGLGCRNVSKIYLPHTQDVRAVIPHLEHYNHLIDHHKYANNYFYSKSIFAVDQSPHLDNGFVLFQETDRLVSPIAVLYYAHYQEVSQLQSELNQQSEKIQCIVSDMDSIGNALPFGQAQSPGILDYADNIDTMKFLLSL